MMGMLAPVVMEGCRTNPWTGLFSGEDLSMPGGVKPNGQQTKLVLQFKGFTSACKAKVHRGLLVRRGMGKKNQDTYCSWHFTNQYSL